MARSVAGGTTLHQLLVQSHQRSLNGMSLHTTSTFHCWSGITLSIIYMEKLIAALIATNRTLLSQATYDKIIIVILRAG